MIFLKIKKYLAVSLTVLTLCLLPGAIYAENPKAVIIIDAAHGGDDAGVVGIGDVQEKKITLAIALAVKKELATERNFEVFLIREKDKTVSLEERKKIISSMKPALVLSLHVNAGFGKAASGFELYYPGFKDVEQSRKGKNVDIEKTENKYLSETVKLARLVQKNLDQLFPRQGRGLREARTPLMTDLETPILVVELGFATHGQDKSKLTSEKMQMDIAKALAKSIKGYF